MDGHYEVKWEKKRKIQKKKSKMKQIKKTAKDGEEREK